ncbi:hypothetical protein J8J14_21130 [Roseomonas sp. SSH11]|uniref:Uncharacterized protein n=1 Tax=Pararoseomonas baculiformis TaxID=2820812 RepID=A0ABS4AM33_9PROT|nr:hypothetical protein [Pararoseomonas baculiformis]MBP0447279.1 hypothetical protein [Pararoseomonas baculiformis]
MADAISAWVKTLSPANNENFAQSRVIPGATLGEALDNLVDWISRPEGQAIRRWFRTCGMCVDLGGGYAFPLCEIGYCTTDNQVFRSTYRHHGKGAWPQAKDADPYPAMTGKTRIEFRAFEVMADIWAESRPKVLGLVSPLLSSPGVTTAEKKSKTPEPHHRAPASSTRINQPRASHATGYSTPRKLSVCACPIKGI